MSKIFFATFFIIILAPSTLLYLLLLLFWKHQKFLINIILKMNPFVTTSTQMHISQNSSTNNMRQMWAREGKKESHPLQDYYKSSEITERKQRNKRSRNPKTWKNSPPTHSLKKRIILASTMGIKTYNIQLPENLMYLRLHPSKHGTLHPCQKFNYVNTCHIHIQQWVSQNFILKSKSCIDA